MENWEPGDKRIGEWKEKIEELKQKLGWAAERRDLTGAMGEF